MLDRLTRCLKGELELTQGQIAIGLKFIDKLVPNLAQVEQEITQNAPFAVIPEAAKTKDAWEKAFSPQKPTAGATGLHGAKTVPDSQKH